MCQRRELVRKTLGVGEVVTAREMKGKKRTFSYIKIALKNTFSKPSITEQWVEMSEVVFKVSLC